MIDFHRVWGCALRAAVVMLVLSAPVAAESPVAGYAGSWTGQGQLANAPDAQLRSARCKIEVIAVAGVDELRMEGLCAVAAGRARFVMRTIWLDDTRVQAGFRANMMDETVQFKGRFENGQITLHTRDAVQLQGAPYSARLVLAFTGDDQFTLNEWLTPETTGQTRHVLSLDFEKVIGQTDTQ